MDEAEWLACTDPEPMLAFLKREASNRKLRLFAVACCRRIEVLLVDKRSLAALAAFEQYLDGGCGKAEFSLFSSHAREASDAILAPLYGDNEIVHNAESLAACAVTCALNTTRSKKFALSAISSAYYASHAAAAATVFRRTGPSPDVGAVENAESLAQAQLLQDILGNPFRRVVLNPDWRTPTVTALAAAAYEERSLPRGTLDADRLAVLADALDDAGCTDEQILVHLREPSLHVRGCWVIDLLLGKE
jgi:hypothetical protein